MRPRKVILLVSANEQVLSVQKYMLETRGFRVLVAHDAAAALALHDLRIDLVLGFADGMLREWDALSRQMKARIPETPILVSVNLKNSDARFAVAPHAEAVIGRVSAAELLDWVHMRVARKRGPRKEPRHVQPAAELVMAGD